MCIYIYIYIYIHAKGYTIHRHMPSTLLYHYKIVKRGGGGGKTTMADSFATLSKRIFPQAFTAVSGSSSAEEGCTDTSAYWKHSNFFAPENGVVPGWISLPCV